jgi:hypothetical protein
MTMRVAAIVVCIAVLHAGSDSIAAQQQSANVFAPRSKPSSPRYLFPTPVPRLTQPSGAPLPQKPEVVCGMTLIPADPNIDPGIRQEIPDDGPRFSIRSVDPRICRRP